MIVQAENGGTVLPDLLRLVEGSAEGRARTAPFFAARLRCDQLQPLQEGPLGRVAAAGTTEAAGEALLPRNPLVGSEREAADAFARLQQSDPETAAALVRQQLADRYAAAARDTQAGTHEAAGIKFRNAIAGTEPQETVLQAVLRGLPSQAAAPELLDVLQATGRRKVIGSATESIVPPMRSYRNRRALLPLQGRRGSRRS